MKKSEFKKICHWEKFELFDCYWNRGSRKPKRKLKKLISKLTRTRMKRNLEK